MNKRAKKTILGCVLANAFCTTAYVVLANYLLPLSQLFGVSIGEVALIYTISGIASFISSLLLGKVMKTIKVRLQFLISAAAFIAFHVVVYMANGITAVYLAIPLFGAATVFGGYSACSTVISWWAGENLGKANSLLSIGLSLMNIAAMPIVASMIQSMGVRNAALTQGLVLGAGIIIFTLLFISEHPSKYETESTNVQTAQQTAASPLPGMPMSQITKTAPFWALLIGVTIFNIVSTAVSSNASVIFQEMGVDAVKAALGISIGSLAGMAWSYIFGAMVDKKGPGLATAVCIAFTCVALIITTILSGFVGVVIVAILRGAIAISGSVGAVSYPRMYGAREAGTLIGIAGSAAAVGGMVGAPVAAFMFDITGNYNLFLYVAAGALVVAAILIWYSTSKKTVAGLNAKFSV